LKREATSKVVEIGVSAEWRLVKAGLGLFVGAISVAFNPHFVAGFGEEVVIFRPSFFGSGFGALWAQRQPIPGDDSEHCGQEGSLFAGVFFSGVHGIGEVSQRIESSLEAQAA